MCSFVLVNPVNAQDTLVPAEINAPRIKYSLTKDAQTLANELIKGKTSEKEKFDVLFAWVANNIRYDHKLYNSGRANRSDKPLKKVLRRRKGICTDYAHLMDTLCYFAGIRNTTVNGYVKEIIFDVNDSLYFDNHAWNAVKLDGFWYLYDATWSSGASGYDYTRFGKWKVRMIKKLALKAKIKTRTLVLNKKKKNKFCGIEGSRDLKSVDVLTLPLIPRILTGILFYFPNKVIETHTYVVNTNYYLTEPEVFSLDHFPNDPNWSFSYDISSVSEFSRDSTYYYRTNSLYTNQQRGGRSCIKCDDFLAMSPMRKEKNIISSSRENNLNNHLVPVISYLSIAQIFLDRVYDEDDSLAKMMLIDSTLFYLDSCKEELKYSRTANRMNSKFHLNKNKAKRNHLLKENKKHWALTKKALKATFKRQMKVRSMVRKSKIYEKRGKKDYNKFMRTFRRNLSSKKLKEEQVQKLRSDLSKYNASSDFLTLRITTTEDSLINHLTTLWSNLLEELNVLNPMIGNFSMDGYGRALFLMDSYDRQIREIRTLIDQQEVMFLATVDTNILMLSDTTYIEFMDLNRLIKKRNAFNVKSAKTMWKLINGGAIGTDSLLQFIEEKKQLMNDDACWNTDNQVILKAVTGNFENFYRQNRQFYRI
ncbi:MAG: transglutaminase domain-containing protein, partial [Crocinitomicaceae bacterium]|nr:transglutaminase domain-containing protein [Crocinitomicaceae bacterium]